MLDNFGQNDKAQPADAVSESGSLSAQSIDLMQSDLFKQLKDGNSSNSVERNGFPTLQIENMDAKTGTKAAAPNFADAHSPFATGAELITSRELTQVGLDPKHVKHEGHTAKNGDRNEKTTVEYPDGLKVTVEGDFHAKESKGHAKSTVELPPGYSIDPKNPDAILDKKGQIVAQMNGDHVTVKVGGQWVDQGPAGITEATVWMKKDGHGINQIREMNSDLRYTTQRK